MKLKITSSHGYHEAMLTIAYLSNKGESNLAPLEYRHLIALCKAAERYEQRTFSLDINTQEEETTSASFESSLYYSLFEFIHASTIKLQDKKLRIRRIISKWVRFQQVAELSSKRAY